MFVFLRALSSIYFIFKFYWDGVCLQWAGLVFLRFWAESAASSGNEEISCKLVRVHTWKSIGSSCLGDAVQEFHWLSGGYLVWARYCWSQRLSTLAIILIQQLLIWVKLKLLSKEKRASPVLNVLWISEPISVWIFLRRIVLLKHTVSVWMLLIVSLCRCRKNLKSMKFTRYPLLLGTG